jgi:hypothetical protein
MAACMGLQTACYSFVPVGAAMAAQGEYVRVQLSAEGSAAVTAILGPQVAYAEGTLSERRADGTIVLGVAQVRLFDGTDRFWSGTGRVELAPAQVAEVQRRAIDRGRTRTASVVLAAVLVGLALVALGTGGAGGTPDGGGSEPPP